MPLILVPAVCAKVCVLVGTTIVGGVTAYIWQHRTTNKKYLADVQGNIRKMLEDPEDPEGSMAIPVNGAFYADSQKKADDRCRAKGFKKAKSKKDVTSKDGKYYVCI